MCRGWGGIVVLILYLSCVLYAWSQLRAGCGHLVRRQKAKKKIRAWLVHSVLQSLSSEAAEHGRVGLSSRPLQAFCLWNRRLSSLEAPLLCRHRPGECLARCGGDTSSSSGKGVF